MFDVITQFNFRKFVCSERAKIIVSPETDINE
jgi:hypothetical protein